MTTYGELDARSGIPLYRQIKEILREEIARGPAEPGGPLTEAQLLSRFGVSRAPIRQALAELANEGYVYRRPGKGTFPISGVRAISPADTKPGYLYEYLGALDGVSVDLTVMEPTRAHPADWLARRPDVDPHEQFFHFGHRIAVDGRRIVESELFLRAPEGFAPTASELEAEGSAFELLEKRFGIALERSEHEVWSIQADEAQAASFGVPAVAPLLMIETRFVATGGALIGYRRLIHQAGDIHFRFTTSR